MLSDFDFSDVPLMPSTVIIEGAVLRQDGRSNNRDISSTHQSGLNYYLYNCGCSETGTRGPIARCPAQWSLGTDSSLAYVSHVLQMAIYFCHLALGSAHAKSW